MEHDEKDVNRWVEERMASLDPSAGWRPDSSAAFARMRGRERAESVREGRRWWMWAMVSASTVATCIAILTVATPAACADPLGCKAANAHVRPESVPQVVRAPERIPMIAASTAPPAYKISGSLSAAVECELYTDYQCPHCATYYLNNLPQLLSGYVETGKVRLIHRDLPLWQHQYSRLAALYANAAGEAGYYEVAATRLFRTQAVWSVDGAIDQQLAHVLPANAMARVRELVKNDAARLEAVIDGDVASARARGIGQTPALVVDSKLVGAVPFDVLKKYLDGR